MWGAREDFRDRESQLVGLFISCINPTVATGDDKVMEPPPPPPSSLLDHHEHHPHH